MNFHSTDDVEIVSITSKMKKSCDIDGTRNEILKCCSPVIKKHLSSALNECIDEDIFPKSFKIAKDSFFFKKGNKKKPANYRPIMLLSSSSKILEKIIHNRMLDFSFKFNLLCPVQNGFRDKLSCVYAIAAVTNAV